MAQGETVAVRDESLRERVESFQERHEFEHLSDATKELLQIGLRESRNPMLLRAKERAVETANMLVVGAVVVAALGVATSLFPPLQGLLAAIVLLTAAAIVLAALEVARGLAGANVVGVRVRELVAEVADR